VSLHNEIESRLFINDSRNKKERFLGIHIMRKDMRGCVNVLHWNMWPKRFQSAHFSTTQLGPSAQHLSVNKDSGKEKFHDHDIAIPANYTEAENIVPTLGRDYKEYNKMKLRAQEKNVPKKSSEEKEQKAIPYKKFKGKRWPKFDTIFSEEFKEVMPTLTLTLTLILFFIVILFLTFLLIFNNYSIEVMISRNFESAVVLYAKMKGSKFLPGDSALTALLTTCQKKNHLKKALEMFGDFSVIGSHPNESAYMSLIRCYSDNGEINQALGLIEDMKDSSLELKLRTYHPILEAACRINDFISALSIIKQMQLGNVVPRSEQLALFLEVSALSGALKETESRKEVDFLLQSAKTDLLGMDTHEMRRVISAFSNISIGSVLKEGILIESKNDIPGEILDSEDSVKNGIHTVVTAINDTYANVPTVMNQTLCIPAINDSNVPLGFNEVTNTGER
jgi:pentatricopeptide repeat protein